MCLACNILCNIQLEIHKVLEQRKMMSHFMFRKALHDVITHGKYGQMFENTILLLLFYIFIRYFLLKIRVTIGFREPF